MKNHQSTQFSNIKTALFSVFGVERLPRLKANFSSVDVIQWKIDSKVLSCFEELFERNIDGLFCVTFIVRIEMIIYALIFLST